MIYKNSNVHPKVESVLSEMQDEYETSAANIQSFAQDRDIKVDFQDKVTVYLIS